MTGTRRTKTPANTMRAITPRMVNHRNRSMSILTSHGRWDEAMDERRLMSWLSAAQQRELHTRLLQDVLHTQVCVGR